ncbi:MAG TPA: SDR family NAD(P)-dependent oxidoreductase [Mycobacteriales bacterium]|nr:SDR family NAD(P)-dependent oxidoreductase [Mycobacteriales bacterium]
MSVLSGRRVLITGASSGIGAATARSVVRAGGSVALLARRKERLDDLSAELGERAVGIPCDVTDPEALVQAVAAAADALGGLDGVVAAAGQSMVGSLATGTSPAWRSLMELNLIAPIAAARDALAHFGAVGRRDVVIVGSSGALTTMPGVGVYAATKRGLQAAVDTLRVELAPHGVNVGLVMPGFFDTEILSTSVVVDGQPPATPMAPMFVDGGAPQPPEVLADAIAFMLALPEGTAINELVIRPTGQLIP